MLSNQEFIIQSLELNLFFLRIMKEHSFFLEAALIPKNSNLIREANNFKNEFTKLLMETVTLSQGIIKPDVQNSEFVTNLTLPAERLSENYTGIQIDSNVTRTELSLSQSNINPNIRSLVTRVYSLNQSIIPLVNSLIAFKSKLLTDFLSCSLFINVYPLLIDHIRREAKLFLDTLTKLQNRTSINMVNDIIIQEIFWNDIMGEHAEFIRGLLDPTEKALFDMSNNFANKFDAISSEAKTLMNNPSLLPKITDESLQATIQIRDFKKQGTEGLLQCKIKSIILPLLGDHVTREANHFLRLLKGTRMAETQL